MANEEDFKLQTCFHCGNKGLLRIAHKYSYNFGGPSFDEVGQIVDYDPQEHFDWFSTPCRQGAHGSSVSWHRPQVLAGDGPASPAALQSNRNGLDGRRFRHL